MKPGVCKKCDAKVAFLSDGRGGFVTVLWDSLSFAEKRNYEENLKIVYSERRGHIEHDCETKRGVVR